MSQQEKIELPHIKMIVDTVFEATDPTTMGTQLTQLLVSVLGVKGASVFVVNPRKKELEILATKGLSLDYINKGPILADKSIGLSNNLEPVIIEDTLGNGLLQYPEKAEQEGIRAIVSLPVKLKGKIVGALRVYHKTPWQVSENELICLNLLTRYIGMALRYFRLSAAVKCTRENLDDIHSIWL